MEVDRQLLEACADAAELLEPADALLDDASTAVGQAVEPDRRIVAGVFVVLVRDDRGMTGSICRVLSQLRMRCTL